MRSPNLDLFLFRGCAKCPLNKNGGPCDRRLNGDTFEVEVRFHADHFLGDIGSRLWHKTDKVKGDAIIDSGIIYCIKAYSTVVPHIYDFIWYGERTITVRLMKPKQLKKKSPKAYAQRFINR